jgi:hypothetical protein
MSSACRGGRGERKGATRSDRRGHAIDSAFVQSWTPNSEGIRPGHPSLYPEARSDDEE